MSAAALLTNPEDFKKKFHQAIKDLIFSCVLIVTFFKTLPSAEEKEKLILQSESELLYCWS